MTTERRISYNRYNKDYDVEVKIDSVWQYIGSAGSHLNGETLANEYAFEAAAQIAVEAFDPIAQTEPGEPAPPVDDGPEDNFGGFRQPVAMDEAVDLAYAMRGVPLPDEERYMHKTETAARVNWSSSPSAQLTAADLAAALREALSRGVFGLGARDRLTTVLARWDEQQAKPDAGRAIFRQWAADRAWFVRALTQMDEHQTRRMADAYVGFLRSVNPATDLTTDRVLARWMREIQA